MSTLWITSDLHLSIATPSKTMEVFGDAWHNYHNRIRDAWLKNVSEEDVVCIGGDISQANTLELASIDIAWLDELPGQKILLKGNHDTWWSTKQKMNHAFKSDRIHYFGTDIYHWGPYTILGVRMWDTPALDFTDAIEWDGDIPSLEHTNQDEKIFKRELQRLHTLLEKASKYDREIIVCMHYPPISYRNTTCVVDCLNQYRVKICSYGHLHALKQNIPVNLMHQDIQYLFTSCEYYAFELCRIETIPSARLNVI